MTIDKSVTIRKGQRWRSKRDATLVLTVMHKKGGDWSCFNPNGRGTMHKMSAFVLRKHYTLELSTPGENFGDN